MKRTYGFLFALGLSLLFAGCTPNTYSMDGKGATTVSGSIGGPTDPQQIVTEDGPGCAVPASVATPIFTPPPLPAMSSRLFCASSDARSCQIAYVPNQLAASPVCNVHVITASGGPSLSTYGAVGGAIAALIYFMLK